MRHPERWGGPGSLASRLFWFVALWVAGVAVVAGIAYAIRFVLASV